MLKSYADMSTTEKLHCLRREVYELGDELVTNILYRMLDILDTMQADLARTSNTVGCLANGIIPD